MSEEKKEGSCSTGSCCSKKLVIAFILGALVFMTGYIVGKGCCPFSGSGQKTCPMMQR